MKPIEARMFTAFMAQHPFCWTCGVTPSRRLFWRDYTVGLEYPRNLENHHIVGGAGRVNVRENLARLCKLCHDLFHGANVIVAGEALPNLKLSHVLAAKLIHDPRWYKPEELLKLRRSALPEPEEIPGWFQAEYLRRRLRYPERSSGSGA